MSDYRLHQERIALEWSKLETQWHEASAKWHDSGKFKFEAKYIRNYQPIIQDTIKQLVTLSHVIAQAKRELK